ncbi:hypothetical protein WN51_12787 [Melipona quadrifasciata]|uniref:Uncharacterized protein n=1 Tax=Melipona quadrifasciata TaxID=166423 RepID=A0A0N0BH64_9HYME|nr:hypothetical protein WN51_12787 [Melipona quadrifasciata]
MTNYTEKTTQRVHDRRTHRESAERRENTHRDSILKPTDALRMIENLNGINDTGVEEFIKLARMRNIYRLMQRASVTVNNQMKFQEIIDVSRSNTATRNNSVIYQIIVPILEEHFWKLLRYIAIPNKIQNSFIAPLLENEYVLNEENNYIPVNYEYVNRYCRESPVGKICKRTQPTIHTETYDPTNDCKTVMFNIVNLTFVPSQNDNGCLTIPQNPIIIQTICESIGHIKITEPSVITSKLDCILTYGNNVMKIRGTIKEAEIKVTNYSLNIPFDERDVKLLRDFLPIVEQVAPDFKKYNNSFEMINNQLENLKNQRRILSTTEITFDELITIATLTIEPIGNRNLLTETIAGLLPKNICIKLFCNETTINNDTQPQVSYTHNIGNLPEVELLQINNRQQGQSPDSSEVTNSRRNTTIGQPKILRFGTKLGLRRGV